MASIFSLDGFKLSAPKKSHQFDLQTLSKHRCSPFQGLQGDRRICRIEQPVKAARLVFMRRAREM